MSWRDDFNASVRDFQRFVVPELEKLQNRPLGNLSVISTESLPGALAAAFDRIGGVDVWLVCQADGKIYSMANRLQWVPPLRGSYRTISVREERFTGTRTERAKLETHHAEGSLYPDLFCQSYVFGKRRHPIVLANFALVHTDDVLSRLAAGAWRRYATTNATFLAIDWDSFANSGSWIEEFPPYVRPDMAEELKLRRRPDLYGPGIMPARHCATCGAPVLSCPLVLASMADVGVKLSKAEAEAVRVFRDAEERDAEEIDA
jgi:hypothetical protein